MGNDTSILKVFLDNPEQWYSVRDISRQCGITWFTASKAIQEIIAKTGLLEEKPENLPGWRKFKISKKRVNI